MCVALCAMQLDLLTLLVVTIFVTALLGGLLIFSWLQNQAMLALAWWGSAILVCSLAMVLLAGRGTLPGWLSIGGANAVLCLSYGLFWAGFRVFEGHRPLVVVILAGAVLWLAACGVPAFYKSFGARLALTSLVTAAYMLLCVREIRRAHAGRLGSRGPLAVVLVLHATLMVSRLPTSAYWGDLDEGSVFTAPWIAGHSFAALLFSVTTSFLLLCLTKERVEAEQRAIASRDPLTGVLNRRAFLERGRALLDEARRERRDCALLIVDLDHFKSVNDRFGHGVGDDVLRIFCRLAQAALPAGAVLARLGGEEFACLFRADAAASEEVAERLRDTVATYRFESEHEAFAATVSIGLAGTSDFGHILDALIAAADVGLYRAKNEGRNRVDALRFEASEPGSPSELRLAA